MLFQYFLLNGVMGVIVCILNIIRNLVFIYNEKHSRNNPIGLLFIFSAFSLILTLIFYTSIIDLIPCTLSLLGLFAYWCPSTKILRILNILCSFCYIIYAIPLQSYFTIICELYLILTTFIGLIKHENNSLSFKENKSTFFKLLKTHFSKRKHRT